MNYEKKHPILQKLEEYFKNTPKEQIKKDWYNILKDTDSEAYYEQKYNQALERARDLMTKQNPPAFDKHLIGIVFPELAESKDEKIKREILELVSIAGNGNQFEEIKDWLEKQNEQTKEWSNDDKRMLRELCRAIWNYIPYDEAQEYIIWLQKQCVQKNTRKREIDDAYLQGICDAKHEIEKQGEPTDKVEPKFHEGDWIISNNNKKSIYQVIEVKRGIYVIRDNVDNHEYHIGIEKCEKSGRLFTINDAKDGDVLVSSSGKPFIFKGFFDNDPMAYGGLVADDSFWPASNSNWTTVYCKPATKEQRDILFQKMHEAGYEWDAEKKELKKIEPKTLDPDKVIAWMRVKAPKWLYDMVYPIRLDVDAEDLIKQFKKDFGL